VIIRNPFSEKKPVFQGESQRKNENTSIKKEQDEKTKGQSIEVIGTRRKKER
jgi:hypothetical protein